MKAVRITHPGRAEVQDVAEPGPDLGEVVVDVAYTAVCSTDRKLVARGEPAGRIPGHEVSGLLADGTPVGVHPDTGCGACPFCAEGRSQRCSRHMALGIDQDGGFAERLVVKAAHAVPIGEIPLAVAPLLEPLACTLHAASRLRVTAGETAVVVGSGAMGILAMWALQALGLDVSVCQRGDERRAQARELGAREAFGPQDDPVRVIGHSPDVVLVTPPGTAALRWALEHVAEGGRVHAFAGSAGAAEVDANRVHYRHLDLVGSTGSGLADYHRAIDLVRGGAIDLVRLPCVPIDLAGVPAALTARSTGRSLRAIARIGAGA